MTGKSPVKSVAVVTTTSIYGRHILDLQRKPPLIAIMRANKSVTQSKNILRDLRSCSANYTTV